MKTIDVLVEEIPKCGGWPDAAIGAGFLSGEGTLYFWDKNNDCPPKWTIDTDIEVEDSDEEVTREQYEAALAAKNEGWIEWGGGGCPVSGDTVVEVKYRNPLHGHINNRQACYFSWSHEDDDGDIIAYRLHNPQEAEQAKEDDETDLNECIGQDAAPVWNGAGLPPVGCECEYLDRNNEWYPVTIKYASNQIVVICGTTNIFGEEQETEIAKDIQLDKPQFRLIRSEADRKRDEAVEAIDRYMPEFIPDTPNDYYNAKKIYDAIAAGKIPGVKLED